MPSAASSAFPSDEPSPRRITASGALEIQAYEQLCFPGLASEWKEWELQRPFVGTLTMELMTDADEQVASWIAAGPRRSVSDSVAQRSNLRPTRLP